MNSAKSDNEPIRRDSTASATSESVSVSSTPPTQQQRKSKPIIEAKPVSAPWLACEILKHSDVSLLAVADANANNVGGDNEANNVVGGANAANNNNAVARGAGGNGDICLFHYPMTFFPHVSINDMRRAFELILLNGDDVDEVENGAANEAENDDGLNENEDVVRDERDANLNDTLNSINDTISNSSDGASSNAEEETTTLESPHLQSATLSARNQITRIQLSSYQFECFPNEIVGRVYSNLAHVDIRQNGTTIAVCMTVKYKSLVSSSIHLYSCLLKHSFVNMYRVHHISTTQLILSESK